MQTEDQSEVKDALWFHKTKVVASLGTLIGYCCLNGREVKGCLPEQ